MINKGRKHVCQPPRPPAQLATVKSENMTESYQPVVDAQSSDAIMAICYLVSRDRKYSDLYHERSTQDNGRAINQSDSYHGTILPVCSPLVADNRPPSNQQSHQVLTYAGGSRRRAC
ncbi:hypothetical protein TMatcc_008062 [Talaromyces marneffei ATCC 18224]